MYQIIKYAWNGCKEKLLLFAFRDAYKKARIAAGLFIECLMVF